MNSEYYMRMALDLAKKGMGYTSPNPMVGKMEKLLAKVTTTSTVIYTRKEMLLQMLLMM